MKKAIGIVFAMILSISLLTACTRPENTKQTIETTVPASHIETMNIEDTVCYFTFDEGAPVATDTQLNIYSLYEDEDITQMIIQFQKANPNITVEHEVGLSGEDGMTEAMRSEL